VFIWLDYEGIVATPRHNDCSRATTPKSNQEYWNSKFNRNVQRFSDVYEQIKNLGWNVMVVWECEIKDIDGLTEKLCDELTL